jgi:hypothetical protein
VTAAPAAAAAAAMPRQLLSLSPPSPTMTAGERGCSSPRPPRRDGGVAAATGASKKGEAADPAGHCRGRGGVASPTKRRCRPGSAPPPPEAFAAAPVLGERPNGDGTGGGAAAAPPERGRGGVDGMVDGAATGSVTSPARIVRMVLSPVPATVLLAGTGLSLSLSSSTMPLVSTGEMRPAAARYPTAGTAAGLASATRMAPLLTSPRCSCGADALRDGVAAPPGVRVGVAGGATATALPRDATVTPLAMAVTPAVTPAVGGGTAAR